MVPRGYISRVSVKSLHLYGKLRRFPSESSWANARIDLSKNLCCNYNPYTSVEPKLVKCCQNIDIFLFKTYFKVHFVYNLSGIMLKAKCLKLTKTLLYHSLDYVWFSGISMFWVFVYRKLSNKKRWRRKMFRLDIRYEECFLRY